MAELLLPEAIRPEDVKAVTDELVEVGQRNESAMYYNRFRKMNLRHM